MCLYYIVKIKNYAIVYYLLSYSLSLFSLSLADHVHSQSHVNMYVNKHVYINGTRKKQLEIVNYLANDIPRGFGDLWSLSLGLKIDVIRTCMCYY